MIVPQNALVVLMLPLLYLSWQIELAWCTAKRALRAKLSGKIADLRANLVIELDGFKHLWITKWFSHVRHFEEGYLLYPDDYKKVYNSVKQRSHRRAKVNTSYS